MDAAALSADLQARTQATLDAALARQMEPRAPAPATRLQMIRALTEAGVRVRVMCAPIIPGLTDHEIEALLGYAPRTALVHRDDMVVGR